MDIVSGTLKRVFGITKFSLLVGDTRYPFVLHKKLTGFNQKIMTKASIVFAKATGAFTADQEDVVTLGIDEDANELVFSFDQGEDDPIIRRFNALDFQMISADSSALTGSSEAIFSNGQFELPANFFKPGVYEFYARVVRSGVNSTDTSRTRVRLGATTLTGTVLADSTALATVANDVLELHGYLEVRDVGATGHILAAGKVEGLVLTSPAETVKRTIVGSTVLDTTAALLFEVTNIMSSSSAGNTATLKAFWLRKVS